MKILYFALLSFLVSHNAVNQTDNIEFVCTKTHKASNTCYFNFKVDGAKYTYVDLGCKRSKKREETIKKIKEGDLALSRDWKIDCPEAKQ